MRVWRHVFFISAMLFAPLRKRHMESFRYRIRNISNIVALAEFNPSPASRRLTPNRGRTLYFSRLAHSSSECYEVRHSCKPPRILCEMVLILLITSRNNPCCDLIMKYKQGFSRGIMSGSNISMILASCILGYHLLLHDSY